jgi:hypothetical protein
MKAMIFVGAALVGLAVSPAPLRAAEAETLGCIAAGIDPSVPASLAEDLFVTTQESGQQARKDAAIETVATKAVACKEKHGWSDAAMAAGIAYAVTAFTVPAAEQALTGDGIDPAVVTRVFRALPAEMRASFQQDPIPDATIAAYLGAAGGAGLKVESETHGEHLGLLAGLLAVAEGERAKFLAN